MGGAGLMGKRIRTEAASLSGGLTNRVKAEPFRDHLFLEYDTCGLTDFHVTENLC